MYIIQNLMHIHICQNRGNHLWYNIQANHTCHDPAKIDTHYPRHNLQRYNHQILVHLKKYDLYLFTYFFYITPGIFTF